MLATLTEQLSRSAALSRDQITEAVGQLIQEAVPVETKAVFLAALAHKGETIDEIAGFARELREKCVPFPLDPETRAGEILDVCGTGGDHLNTFNISTTVAFVAAAAGIAVAKHGNRAITSQAGSADVLEALGIRIDLAPDQAAVFLRDHRFVFLFAPRYHPAFKNIGPARKLCAERGQRTIFNFLGPLLNPARPSAQLIGVPRRELCEPVARVLQSLGARRGLVVSGRVPVESRSPGSERERPTVLPLPKGEGWGEGEQRVQMASRAQHDDLSTRSAESAHDAQLDEFSTLGENFIAEFYQERGFATSTLPLDQFPLQKASLADLRGGDARTNAEIIRRLLRGEDKGPRRDAVLLNAAAALFVAGRAKSLAGGWDFAAELIDSGKANTKLDELIRASRG